MGEHDPNLVLSIVYSSCFLSEVAAFFISKELSLWLGLTKGRYIKLGVKCAGNGLVHKHLMQNFALIVEGLERRDEQCSIVSLVVFKGNGLNRSCNLMESVKYAIGQQFVLKFLQHSCLFQFL